MATTPLNRFRKQFSYKLRRQKPLYGKRINAKAFGAAIRGHWSVESNHYVRDVTLHEDESRIRIKPVNFGRLRSIALNVLRANGIKNVARALYKNALGVENVLSYSLS